MSVLDERDRGVVAFGARGKQARAAAGERPDLIRKEEIPATGVHSVWDARMVPSGDDPGRRG
jgi:hypothetical protein